MHHDRSFDKDEIHICRVCRKHKMGCVKKVIGFKDRDEWVCQQCLEDAGQQTLHALGCIHPAP